ncbi:DUF2341 domain-containing protein [Candidatus Parcubacteria bacterium]|nr:DUF2341 domain-containing protein [Candidatus Parcubacteria bacterium]
MLKASKFLLIPVLGIFLFLFGFSEKIVLADEMFGNSSGGGWTKKQEIQINPDNVAGDLIDFPLLITEDNIDLEIFSQALWDGCDIRFTVDGDENNLEEISFEIVNFNGTGNKAEIWVKVPFINSSAITSVWIWWGNELASCYEFDNLFGRNNVWNDYDDVFHLNESLGTTVAVNSVGEYDGEYLGNVPNISRGGKIGNSQYFDGSGDEVVTFHMVNLYNKDFTIGAWVYSDVMGDNSIISRWGGRDYLCWTLRTDWSRSTATENAWTFGYSVNGDGDTEVFKHGLEHISNEWIYVTAVKRNSHLYIGANGIEVDTGNFFPSIYEGVIKGIIIGGTTKYSDMYFNGMIDEARVSSKVGRSAEWIQTEYNNQNSPQDFAIGQEVQGAEEEPQNQKFSFIHMTDPHIGSSWIPGHRWYEELSYPRFTDSLYEISRLAKKPDFILMGGDLVEHAESRWLKDYQSMIDSFTAQTSIPVYAVPGNHDRYMWVTGNALCGLSDGFNCEDGLAEYKKQINIPGQGLDESNYLNQGNPFDYQFTHKGIQFIGLDSGADYMPDYEIKDLATAISGDKGIEGDGLTNEQVLSLGQFDFDVPKIVFMHHPVFTGAYDTCSDPACSQNALEDASFANNHEEFVTWGENSNLQLVLAGHTHRDEIYDINNKKYPNISSASGIYPLFIQTQSATHDGSIGHGYRLVDVENGAVNPQDVSETEEYIKLISQLDIESNHEFRVYNPDNDLEYIEPDDTGSTEDLFIPFFTASDSKRILLYGMEKNYANMQVWQKDSSDNDFDLNTRIEGVILDDVNYENDFGYRIGSIFKKSFVHFHLENKFAAINAKNISFEDSSPYQFKVDWDELIETKNINHAMISNDFNQNSGVALALEEMKFSLIAKLFSPAELAVIEKKTGSSTGIVNHESIEEIDYSLSDEARERVLIYADENLADKDFIYSVQGLEDIYGAGDNDFSLKIVYKIYDETGSEITEEVNIIDMPISSSITYQFYVDWDNLSNTQGVIMEVDEDGDGIFEIRIELGQEINSANPYYLREKMILNLESVKIGETQVDEKINFIISLINKSLNSDWWENDYYLNEELGDNVFKIDLITAQKLRLFLGLDLISKKKYMPKFIEDKFRLPNDVKMAFENALNDLLRSDMILARVAVNDFTQNVDSKKDEKILKTAENKLEKAEKLLYNKKIQIVQFCRQAWRMVN